MSQDAMKRAVPVMMSVERIFEALKMVSKEAVPLAEALLRAFEQTAAELKNRGDLIEQLHRKLTKLEDAMKDTSEEPHARYNVLYNALRRYRGDVGVAEVLCRHLVKKEGKNPAVVDRISAIRVYRDTVRCSLKDGKETIDQWMADYDIRQIGTADHVTE